MRTALSPVFGAISRCHDPEAVATRRHPSSTTAPNNRNLYQNEAILSKQNRIPGATNPAPNEHHFELAKLKSIAGGSVHYTGAKVEGLDGTGVP